MTVKELIHVCTCPIWITFEEDPNNEAPNIILDGTCDDMEYGLSDEILNHEIHLMTATKEGAMGNCVIFVSLFIANDYKDEDNR